MARILLLSTLDTKGKETGYLAGRIAACGCEPLVMDLSMRQGEGRAADISPEKVAAAGGLNWEEVISSQERAKITERMIKGAKQLARDLLAEGRVQGIIGLGGSTGSLMATEVMRALPFGLPKLMVSSTAALPGLSTRYIDTGDIALFHTVVEITGLSDLLKNLLDRAASSICAMAKGEVAPLTAERDSGGKRIALTMLGPCEKCASRVREALEGWGYQVIGFSAAGVCDRAMEEMILQGLFDGVIDLAPGGVGEHLFGGMRDAGPNRLEGAGKMGIPQVIAPCGVNHLTPPKSKYTAQDQKRRKYDLDRYRTWLRATPEELRSMAGAFAEKLNAAKGPAVFLFPALGWSSVDGPGQPTHDPQEDRVFLEELRARLDQGIQVREVEANLEDPAFAEALIRASRELFGGPIR